MIRQEVAAACFRSRPRRPPQPKRFSVGPSRGLPPSIRPRRSPRTCPTTPRPTSALHRTPSPQIPIAPAPSPSPSQRPAVSSLGGFQTPALQPSPPLFGRCSPAVLRSYSDERRRVAKELIDFDREWAKMFSASPKDPSKPDSEGVDPAEFQKYFMKQLRFTAGTETRTRRRSSAASRRTSTSRKASRSACAFIQGRSSVSPTPNRCTSAMSSRRTAGGGSSRSPTQNIR